MSKADTNRGMGSKAWRSSADVVISVDEIGPDQCDESVCFSCGCKLDEEAIEAGREQCFDCYFAAQG
jgi:hypothetical protein